MTAAEEPRAVTEEILIDAAPETVFEFFVDPALMRKWIGAHPTLDPRPGGVFAVDVGPSQVRGVFIEIVPPARVVFTWGWEGSAEVPHGSSTVTFTLEAKDAGTLLRMVHEGLPAGEDVRHVQGWTHYLGRLTEAARGMDPGPDSHASSGEIPPQERSGNGQWHEG